MPDMEKIAVICAGNRLMLDDGVGPAAYDVLTSTYLFPDNVTFFDVGCMSMTMLNVVREFDFIITVDAVDGLDADPGTVFRFMPDDIGGHALMQSLHDLRLIDLLNAASLLGYTAEGVCYGMQVENLSPSSLCMGLTPHVQEALPLLVDAILAELMKHGVEVRTMDGAPFVPPTPEQR